MNHFAFLPINNLHCSIPFISVPLPPQNVQVTETTATSATFQWQPPAGGVYDSYIIVHGPTDGSAAPTVEQIPAGTTQHTLNNIDTVNDFVTIYSASGEQISVPGFPQVTSRCYLRY